MKKLDLLSIIKELKYASVNQWMKANEMYKEKERKVEEEQENNWGGVK